MTSRLQKHKQILSMMNTRQDMPVISMDDEDRREVSTPESQSLLKQVFNFHRSLVQGINAGLLTVDLSGEITFANKVAAKLLGLEVSDLLGKPLAALFNNPEDGTAFLRQCAHRGQRIEEWEARLFHPQKRQIVVGIDAAYMEDGQNDFQGIVLLLRDLTEVSEMRSQVKLMEQMALLGEMAAGLAHEVRNPLAGIKATAQLLEEDDDLSTLHRETLQRLIREVDKADHRISQFLKFARPQRAKADFHAVRELVENACMLLSPKLKWQNVRLHIEIAEQLPPVFADKTQVEQILLNLVINAIDAMPNGGDIRITGKQRAVSAGKRASRHGVITRQRQTFVQLEVSDTGEGIRKDHLAQVFSPFFTTKTEGVGLGLAICRRLAEENRGKIEVASQPGKGATFTLLLPAFAAAV